MSDDRKPEFTGLPLGFRKAVGTVVGVGLVLFGLWAFFSGVVAEVDRVRQQDMFFGSVCVLAGAWLLWVSRRERSSS